jgi:hypothetical protein
MLLCGILWRSPQIRVSYYVSTSEDLSQKANWGGSESDRLPKSFWITTQTIRNPLMPGLLRLMPKLLLRQRISISNAIAFSKYLGSKFLSINQEDWRSQGCPQTLIFSYKTSFKSSRLTHYVSLRDLDPDREQSH